MATSKTKTKPARKRKPDPLTANMLFTLKKVRDGKTVKTSGATTSAEGAAQGGAVHTLRMLARRGLIQAVAGGGHRLSALGQAALGKKK